MANISAFEPDGLIESCGKLSEDDFLQTAEAEDFEGVVDVIYDNALEGEYLDVILPTFLKSYTGVEVAEIFEPFPQTLSDLNNAILRIQEAKSSSSAVSSTGARQKNSSHTISAATSEDEEREQSHKQELSLADMYPFVGVVINKMPLLNLKKYEAKIDLSQLSDALLKVALAEPGSNLLLSELLYAQLLSRNLTFSSKKMILKDVLYLQDELFAGVTIDFQIIEQVLRENQEEAQQIKKFIQLAQHERQLLMDQLTENGIDGLDGKSIKDLKFLALLHVYLAEFFKIADANDRALQDVIPMNEWEKFVLENFPSAYDFVYDSGDFEDQAREFLQKLKVIKERETAHEKKFKTTSDGTRSSSSSLSLDHSQKLETIQKESQESSNRDNESG